MTRTVAVSVRAEAYLAPAVRLMVELLKADGKRFSQRSDSSQWNSLIVTAEVLSDTVGARRLAALTTLVRRL